MTREITQTQWDMAVALANQVYRLRDALHAARTLEAKLDLTRRIAALNNERRHILEVA